MEENLKSFEVSDNHYSQWSLWNMCKKLYAICKLEHLYVLIMQVTSLRMHFCWKKWETTEKLAIHQIGKNSIFSTILYISWKILGKYSEQKSNGIPSFIVWPTPDEIQSRQRRCKLKFGLWCSWCVQFSSGPIADCLSAAFQELQPKRLSCHGYLWWNYCRSSEKKKYFTSRNYAVMVDYFSF